MGEDQQNVKDAPLQNPATAVRLESSPKEPAMLQDLAACSLSTAGPSIQLHSDPHEKYVAQSKELLARKASLPAPKRLEGAASSCGDEDYAGLSDGGSSDTESPVLGLALGLGGSCSALSSHVM